MTKKNEEQRLLETSRNQWLSFELRYVQYSVEQKRLTAKAVVDCADTLSRYLAIDADNIIFGRNVFTATQAELLMTGLRKLQNHALEERFDCGATAVLALKAVASLILLAHKTRSPLIRQQRDDDLVLIGTAMDLLLGEHHVDGSRLALAAQ